MRGTRITSYNVCYTKLLRGESGRLIDEGATKLGGRVPVNTSGGLLRKGHPVGATGIAQIVELTEQLQARCGRRQIVV